MAKSRIQTLQNQIRILKEQTIALEEKGRHDDELVEALTARLKTKGKFDIFWNIFLKNWKAILISVLTSDGNK